MSVIYTIGHSNHSFDDFVEMLKSWNIELVIDIRSFPGSKRYPHFGKESLEIALPKHKINYKHMRNLGGRRSKGDPNSINTGWRLASFRNYADYMQTDPFNQAIKDLEELAKSNSVAYMCSEVLWWSCHRSLVSDYLKSKGWTVQHIMNKLKINEHPYTSPAKLIEGKLSYRSTSNVNNNCNNNFISNVKIIRKPSIWNLFQSSYSIYLKSEKIILFNETLLEATSQEYKRLKKIGKQSLIDFIEKYPKESY